MKVATPAPGTPAPAAMLPQLSGSAPPMAVLTPTHVVHFDVDRNGILIVDAAINFNPRYSEAAPPNKRYAIDTGASHTCFFASPDMVVNLSKVVPGAKLDSWIAWDGNSVQVCRFEPGKIYLIGLSQDMPVYAASRDLVTLTGFDGVIGQDFLSRFNVDIDYDLGVMMLTARPGKSH